jgi:hypothetical protein
MGQEQQERRQFDAMDRLRVGNILNKAYKKYHNDNPAGHALASFQADAVLTLLVDLRERCAKNAEDAIANGVVVVSAGEVANFVRGVPLVEP